MEITSWEQLQELEVNTEIRIMVENVYWGYAQIKWKTEDAIGIGCEIIDSNKLIVHLFPDSFDKKTKHTYIRELFTVDNSTERQYA